MEAANPMCRLLLLAVGLAAVLGCRTDGSAAKARGQVPQDPLAPIAPPLTPPPGVVPPMTPTGPNAPITPLSPTPGAPSAPPTPIAPSIPGVAPASPTPVATPIPGTSPAPLTPIASPAPGSPAAPLGPIMAPAPGVSPGTAPALVGVVTGSPVPPEVKGAVVPASALGSKSFASTADMLKAGVPRVKVIAIVGANNVITDQEVRESVWQQNRELLKITDSRARAAKEQELYTGALRRMIERELILDEMYTKLKKANKASVIDEIREYAVQTAEKQVRDMKKQSGAKSDDDLNVLLRAEGLTLPVLRRQLERQIMSQQYVNSMLKETGRRVGLAEIRDYYDKHPDEFKTPDRVRWQHLFISFAKHTTAQAAYNHAEGIRQKAAGGADFGALSKEFDNGTAGFQGGFGVGEKRGEVLPLDVEPAVWSLKMGQVSGLIQTPTGIHIVKVVERDYEGVVPFDAKVQTKIRDKMNEAIYDVNARKLIEDLWRKGVVRVLED